MLIGTRRALLSGRKAENPWWDPNGEGLSVWAAYQPKGAASLADSYTDLSGNSHDAGVGVAPTWDAANGWILNGSTQYLTTTFVPQNDQTQSVLVQYTNYSDAGTSYWLAGVRCGTDRTFGFIPNDGSNRVQYYNGQELKTFPLLVSGNVGIAGNTAYRNGTAESGTMGAWGGISDETFAIGCRGGSTPSLFGASYIQALAIYNTTLTAPQMSAIATRMAAL